MRVLCIALMVALLAGPVYAQDAVPKYGDTDKDKSPQEKAAEREAEKAYRRSLSNIPERAASDPWGTVRSDDSLPKAATTKSPPVKKTKASGTAN